ncbi:MAG: peptide chain release factor 2 [Candidatus Enteromonas sp.]|nr:peptide chain release factor 2 [Candidatus Enteromonas sp.]
MRNLAELKQGVYELGKLVDSLGESLDLPKIDEEIALLTEQQNADGFWDDPNKARTVTSRLAALTEKKTKYLECRSTFQDIKDMIPEVSEKDAEMMELLDSMETELTKKCEDLQHKLLFSDKYDSLNCTIEIHPGAGGTEAQDWASMLLRMYGRFAERNNFKTQVIDIEEGDEAGIKSATIKIIGEDAYGFLKGEKGVHRLVRISPFDAAARRHTSFASVNVIPEFGEVSDVVIDPKDLRVDTYRSGGAGGQNVNKVSSAVRITHLPTGIVVQCQIERSQLMNKATCMSMLSDLLMQRKLEERERQLKSIQGEQKNIEWGSQIRSYVFQPYTMVKDHRTDFETGDVNGVMDGNIVPFMYAYLEMESRKDGKKSS